MNTEEKNNTESEVDLNEQKHLEETVNVETEKKESVITEQEPLEKSGELFETSPVVTPPIVIAPLESYQKSEIKNTETKSDEQPLEKIDLLENNKNAPEEIQTAIPVTSIPVVRNYGPSKITFMTGSTRWWIEKNARIPLTSIPQWVKQHPEFQQYRRDKILVFESLTNNNNN